MKLRTFCSYRKSYTIETNQKSNRGIRNKNEDKIQNDHLLIVFSLMISENLSLEKLRKYILMITGAEVNVYTKSSGGKHLSANTLNLTIQSHSIY